MIKTVLNILFHYFEFPTNQGIITNLGHEHTKIKISDEFQMLAPTLSFQQT